MALVYQNIQMVKSDLYHVYEWWITALANLIDETSLQKLRLLTHNISNCENFLCKPLLLPMLLISVLLYRFLILFQFLHIYISKGNFQLHCHMHRPLFCSALACKAIAFLILRFVSQLGRCSNLLNI